MLRAWVTQTMWALSSGFWSFLPVLVFIKVHLCFHPFSAVLHGIQGPLARASEEGRGGNCDAASSPLPGIPSTPSACEGRGWSFILLLRKRGPLRSSFVT